MNQDDVIYVTLLFLSIFIGVFFRDIKSPQIKQCLSTCVGVLIVLLVSGVHAAHPLIVTIVNATIISFGPKRYSHLVSFFFCFAYLGFFRCSHYFGIPKYSNHLNAVMMMMTLKMVSVAFEAKDSSEPQETLQYRFTKVDPSFTDVLHYSFCYIGILTGPYFKFRTYWDWLHKPYSTYDSFKNDLLMKIKHLIPCVGVHFLVGYLYPIEIVLSGEILKSSFLYRWWFMFPSVINFRFRLYCAYILAESSYITSGLGAYPEESKPCPGQGPSDYEKLAKSEDQTTFSKIKYDCIYNMDIIGFETVPTLKQSIRLWNKTVQFWMAAFVHKRMKYLRVPATLFVSAYWHGVYPSYYLFFFSIGIAMVTESSIKNLFNAKGTTNFLNNLPELIFKVQTFSYFGMSFVLLQVDATLQYWKSIHFCGHILLLIALIGLLIPAKQKAKKENTLKDR